MSLKATFLYNYSLARTQISALLVRLTLFVFSAFESSVWFDALTHFGFDTLTAVSTVAVTHRYKRAQNGLTSRSVV